MWLVATSPVSDNLPFRLDEGEYIIGRIRRAHILISDATVSRQHARLFRYRHETTLEDLQSTNGTSVNDGRIERSPIAIGDHVRFGGVNCAISSSPLTFQTHAEDESTFQIRREHGDTTQIEAFTPAQQEIISCLLQGHAEAEIASILGKSPHTIHTRLKAIFRWVGVHSRAEFIVKLIKRA